MSAVPQFPQNFMPHGHCYFWRSDLLGLHILSDVLIISAYYSIPIALLYFVYKRKDLAFDWLFILFGLFIFSCGTTHILNIITVWYPMYWIEGWIKLATGLVSVLTAVLLWPAIPRLLALPSPAELSLAKEKLEEEVRERRQTQAQLEKLNQELEQRVLERTQELQDINAQLEQAINKHLATQEQLHEQAQQLSHSNAELEQYAYVVAHDLRSPVGSIQSFALLLQQRCGEMLDEKGKQFIAYIQKGAQRMDQLITDLLEYAKLGNVENKYLTPLSSLVAEVLENLSEEIQEKEAQIEISELPHLRVSPVHIQQLFQNLIGNALKFCPDTPHIQIEAQAQSEHWLFSVCDNGIGFDDNQKERIFQIFQRLHGNEDHYSGTGLGLAVCKKVVERHGGKIWAEGKPEQGSCFYFTLPRSDLEQNSDSESLENSPKAAN